MKTASGLAMALVVIVMIAAGAAALKLHSDRQAMASMVGDFSRTLGSMPKVPVGAAQAFANAAQMAQEGDAEGAQQALKHGANLAREAAAAAPQFPRSMPGGPGVGPGSGGPGTGPGGRWTPPQLALSEEEMQQALQGIDEEARPFFVEHPELWRRALSASNAAQQIMPDEAWKTHRAAVIKAAAANDAAGVRQALNAANQAMAAHAPRPDGGPGGDPKQQLSAQIGQFKDILPRMKQAGVNTKRIEELVNRAEQMVERGDYENAAARLREAFGMMQKLRPQGGQGGPPGGRNRPPGMRPGIRGGQGGPGMRGGQRGAMRGPGMRGGQRGPGGPGGMGGMMMNPLIGALLGHMQGEQGVLGGVMEDIENAGIALLESNQDQIREILAKATKKVQSIGQGRDNLEKQLQGASRPPQGDGPRGDRPGPGGRGGRGGQRPPGQMGPGGMPPGGPGMGRDPQQMRQMLSRFMDEARSLSPEEYEAGREQLLGRLMARMMGRGGEQGPPMPPVGPEDPASIQLEAPRVEIPEAEPTKPADREAFEAEVRGLIRTLQDPYLQLSRIEPPVDLEEIDRLVDEAREAVNAGRLVEAAQSANHLSDLLFELFQLHREEIAALPREPEASPEPAVPQPPAPPGQ